VSAPAKDSLALATEALQRGLKQYDQGEGARPPPRDLAEATARLKESNDKLAVEHRPSKPPSAPRQPVASVALSRERAREIERIIQERALLSAFGVTPAELAAFCSLAKKGADQ
jgi:hypothetical protein